MIELSGFVDNGYPLFWFILVVLCLMVLGAPAGLLYLQKLLKRAPHPINTALLASMFTAVIVTLVVSALGQNLFQASGTVRRALLPLTYLLFFIALLIQLRRSRLTVPIWWTGLLVSTLSSTIASVVYARQPLEIEATAAGLVFIGGLIVTAALGLSSGDWSSEQKQTFISIVALFAGIGALLDIHVGSYIAILGPAGFGLIYLGIAQRRLGAAVAGLALLVAGIYRLFESATEPSLAVVGHYVVSGAVVVLMLLPHVARKVAIIASVLTAPVLVLTSSIGGIFTGSGVASQDLTIAQRIYETQVVLTNAAENPVTWLLGLGPAGTVNLTQSPDVFTLYSSGRVLDAVDDVHVLTSWLLLKLGFIGLICFGVLVLAAMTLVWWVARGTTPEPFEVFLVAIAASGIVAAIPAATFFFSNPLPILALGILEALRRKDRGRNPVSASAQRPALGKAR